MSQMVLEEFELYVELITFNKDFKCFDITKSTKNSLFIKFAN